MLHLTWKKARKKVLFLDIDFFYILYEKNYVHIFLNFLPTLLSSWMFTNENQKNLNKIINTSEKKKNSKNEKKVPCQRLKGFAPARRRTLLQAIMFNVEKDYFFILLFVTSMK